MMKQNLCSWFFFILVEHLPQYNMMCCFSFIINRYVFISFESSTNPVWGRLNYTTFDRCAPYEWLKFWKLWATFATHQFEYNRFTCCNRASHLTQTMKCQASIFCRPWCCTISCDVHIIANVQEIGSRLLNASMCFQTKQNNTFDVVQA